VEEGVSREHDERADDQFAPTGAKHRGHRHDFDELVLRPDERGAAELFPTNVRYTGSGIAYNVSGILGAAIAPFIATWLATKYRVAWVGVYLSAAAILTCIALLLMRETKDISLDIALATTSAGPSTAFAIELLLHSRFRILADPDSLSCCESSPPATWPAPGPC
jgi:hypothetical protein